MFVRNCIFCFVLVVIFSCEKEKATRKFPKEEQVKTRMDSLMTESDLKGLVVIAVNKEGERIEYAHGNAIWNEDSPLQTNHIFRIASMTKLITSVAALQLVENKMVGLDEDLSELLPEMAALPVLNDSNELVKSENAITLRHLLTHSSGFGYSFTDSLLASFDKSNWEHNELPRRFESGTQFLYGTSTDWVGKLVEKVSGLNLEAYFREHITGPLQMNRTWFNVPDSLQHKIVSYGRRGDNGKENLSEIAERIPKEKIDVYSGGGGLYSSPEDYTKIINCLLNDGILGDKSILQKETVNQLFEKQLNGISMDISNNYFNPGVCCNFNGLIKPTSSWSLGGMIDTETTYYGRKGGTLLWGGVLNTYWYIDRKSGVVASIYTQHLPFNHSETTQIFDLFSEMLYENYEN